MVDEARILEALRGVNDPELGRNLVELGMVHDVVIDGGTVHFTLALTTLGCPLIGRMTDDARAALLKVDGIDDVAIENREMTAEEKEHALPKQQESKSGAAQHLNRIEKVVAVMSGKGGVGKSSVAALLAVALRRKGLEVGVLDADITGPSIPKMFGLSGTPPVGPVGILPAMTSTGIKVMSINLLLPREDEAVIWRGPLIAGAIQQFWGDVVWGDVDVLVVDLPPGTSDAALTVMQSIPLNGVVLVTSPQDLAGMVVRKAGRMAQQLKIHPVGLVENMSYVICPGCEERIEAFGPSHAAETAARMGVPLLGALPLQPELALRSDVGEIEQFESDGFVRIAEQILANLAETPSTPISLKR